MLPMTQVLSVHLDEELAAEIRKAAQKGGTSLSTELRHRITLGSGLLRDGRRIVGTYKDGAEQMTVIASTGSLPVDVLGGQPAVGDALADGEAEFLIVDAAVGADKSGSTQALRDNREMKFDEYLPRRELQPPHKDQSG